LEGDCGHVSVPKIKINADVTPLPTKQNDSAKSLLVWGFGTLLQELYSCHQRTCLFWDCIKLADEKSRGDGVHLSAVLILRI